MTETNISNSSVVVEDPIPLSTGTEIFNLKSQVGSGLVTPPVISGKWTAFLKTNGVWTDTRTRTLDHTFQVNFPVDGYYTIRGCCDDNGFIYLDDKRILGIVDYKKEYSVITLVRAGNHSVRCTGENYHGNPSSDNPAALAVVVSVAPLSLIFDLKFQSELMAPQHSGKDWSSFLKTNGVWPSGDTDTLDYTVPVSFPVKGYYNFRGTCDDNGSIYLGNKEILNICGFKKDYSVTMMVEAGIQSVHCSGKSVNGNPTEKNPASLAVVIDGDIRAAVDAQNIANADQADADKKQADADALASSLYGPAIFSTANMPGENSKYVKSPDQSHYCQFLKDFGVWTSNPDEVKHWNQHHQIDFAKDGNYIFTGSCDDSAAVYINDELVLKVESLTKKSTVTRFFKAGIYDCRSEATNSGGAKSFALDIKELLDNQATAEAKAEVDKAKTTADNAEAAVKQATWQLMPVESLTITNDFDVGASGSVSDSEISGSVSDSVSVGAETNAGFESKYGDCDVRVWVDVSITNEAGASAGIEGNNLCLTVGVNNTMRAEAGVEVNGYVGPVGMNAKGCVYAESGTQASMVVEVGDKGVVLEGGMSIGSCVGAEGSGTVTLFGDEVIVEAGAGVSIGDDHFAAGGGGQATFEDGQISIGVSGDVALFIGLDLDLSVGVNTNDAIKKLTVAYNESVKLANQANNAYDNSVDELNKVANDAANTANDAINSATQAADDAAKIATNSVNQAVNVVDDTIKSTESALTDAGYTCVDGTVKAGKDIANGAVDVYGSIVKVGGKSDWYNPASWF